ncbi:MAG: 3-deoxy-D-manno-octulosonic acid transferase, partial [Muribaculaceae bacterium]|nr:3-deoxy-D-manno-octulosonic acid transferase [Muribaculaceae bacterium]
MLERPLYSFGISAYGAGVKLASLKNDKAKKLTSGQKEIWDKLDRSIDPSARYVWIHAAALGEFEQGRPLIEKLKRERPEFKVLLTFFSPSGYEVRKNYDLADCVCYLPFDTPKRVRRFLYKVNPEVAIFVKYEFWRNYLEELYRRQIPTYLISAVFRKDQSFFKKRSAWYSYWLRWYTRFFVQNEESRQLLQSININNVDVFGDTRFDRVADIRSKGKEIPLLQRFTHRGEEGHLPVMMAGSSWPADEAVYSGWFAKHPEAKLVIAPHEFDAERLRKLKSLFGKDCVLLSEAEKEPSLVDNAKVLVIDCFGLLSSAYAYCDVAYVGGGFGAGLHNINEAAVYDVPVIYGPNNSKFIEAREMAESGGGFPISSREEFERIADRLMLNNKASASERQLAGNKAGSYIRSKLGATDKIFDKIFTHK